ncbi:MAG: ATP-binding protein [Ruminococcus sp.]|nr:ATP-binding protein [Ruminococcus sp.]
MKEFNLPAKLESIPILTDAVNEILEAQGCSMKAQMQLDIAIDEIFANIAHYAYAPGTGDATVRLEFFGEPLSARLTFIDSGVPFDPLERTEPDVTLSAEERQIGGLGIFLVKKTMDAMRYERRDGQNVLVLEKRIG